MRGDVEADRDIDVDVESLPLLNAVLTNFRCHTGLVKEDKNINLLDRFGKYVRI